MRLWSRIYNDLILSDAHGMVDALEDRDLVLRRSLREAELALADKRARLDRLADWLKTESKAVAQARACLSTLDSDVELALGAGEDELARFTVRKLLNARANLETSEAQRAEVAEAHAEHAAELARQEGELNELRGRVRRALDTESAATEVSPQRGSVADEDVELELLRRRLETEDAD